MNDRESISTTQLSFLYFAYATGSAMIVIPGPLVTMALNAAWLAIIISLVIALGLIHIMIYVQSRNPGINFIAISRQTVGKWPSVIIACMMLTMAFHMASGIVVDVAAFMNSMMLPETPNYIFTGLTYLLIALLLRSGIEAIARMFSMLIVVTMTLMLIILILLIPDYHTEFLRPIFPEGIKPLLLGTYLTFGFPYAEVVLFIFVLPFVRTNKSKQLKKVMTWTLLANGAMLIISTLCTVMELGSVAMEKKYSLFVLSQMVEVADIIGRIEAIVGMAMITGSLMKATIAIFAIQIILKELFGLKDDRLISNPLCLVIQLISLTLPATMTEWEELVLIVHPLWVAVVYVLPLLVVAAVAFVKERMNSEQPIYNE